MGARGAVLRRTGVGGRQSRGGGGRSRVRGPRDPIGTRSVLLTTEAPQERAARTTRSVVRDGAVWSSPRAPDLRLAVGIRRILPTSRDVSGVSNDGERPAVSRLGRRLSLSRSPAHKKLQPC